MKVIVNKYIKKWQKKGYDDLPDVIPRRLHELGRAPSYKSIAVALLNNDINSLGIPVKKSKYYHILKKIEIEKRKQK